MYRKSKKGKEKFHVEVKPSSDESDCLEVSDDETSDNINKPFYLLLKNDGTCKS